ncbi:28S ribosomal protein s36 mitochondrial [Plakobranchus ocellatus]|uniref:28S ribosomal protein s36 mitochondrial n=1 Tax=Plakobranchus ocellatus TaxID=259542 RepID=A0AAV3Z816_9GAST|nr:28S ribosomal protein s36 mitochondrial [Plakobranchus ocellatus]
MWQKLASALGLGLAMKSDAVRPHIPLIKFPPRSTVNASKGATSSPNPEQLKPVSSQPLKGKVIDPLNLPRKYHRKPISVEEMEYIEKGGPV